MWSEALVVRRATPRIQTKVSHLEINAKLQDRRISCNRSARDGDGARLFSKNESYTLFQCMVARCASPSRRTLKAEPTAQRQKLKDSMLRMRDTVNCILPAGRPHFSTRAHILKLQNAWREPIALSCVTSCADGQASYIASQP